jgi:hypothetical protein
MVYPKETRGGHGNQETKVLFWVLFLREAQLAGPDYRLGPPLDLELPENALLVPLDGAQGDEKPVRDLLIRESFGDEPGRRRTSSMRKSGRSLKAKMSLNVPGLCENQYRPLAVARQTRAG